MKRYDENLPQIIVIAKQDFGDDFEAAVSRQLFLLLKANRICHVYKEDDDMVVIEYAYESSEYGEPYSAWLSEKEINFLKGLESIEDC